MSVCLNEHVEIAVVRHGMNISIVVSMDADQEKLSILIFLFYFFHLTKKTGLQVHPTTDMQFTESREEGKKKKKKQNQMTHNRPRMFVSATVQRVLEGRRRVSDGWR